MRLIKRLKGLSRLKKLVEIYDKQKELDDSVKKFKDVCNKYLINKKVFYDPTKLCVSIIDLSVHCIYSVFDVNCIICLFTRRPCEHTVKELLLGR